MWGALWIGFAAAGVLTACGEGAPSRGRGGGQVEERRVSASSEAAPTLRVVRLRLRDRTLPTEPVSRLSRAQVREAVRQAVASTPGLRWAGAAASWDRRGGQKRSGAPFALEVDLELQGVSGAERGKASVILSVTARPLGDDADAIVYQVSSLPERVYRLSELRDHAALYRGLLRQGLLDALGKVAARWRLRHAPPTVVARAIRTGRLEAVGSNQVRGLEPWLPFVVSSQLALLGDVGMPALGALVRLAWAAAPTRPGGGSGVRGLAIRVAAIRRLREAVPALVRVLGEEHRGPVRDLCLGALAEIRDPSAVPAVLKFLRADPDERLRKVIAVLGQIGGEEAEAFLEMTADGDAEDDVKELARQSLASLRRRHGTPPPRPSPPSRR